MSDLRHRTITGAAWMLAARFVDRSLGILSTLLLARLLVPADFGLVAMATTIVAVLEILTGFAFDLALIREQNARRAHYDTAWTLNVALGATLAVVLGVLAWPAAQFYQEPRVAPVMIALALASLVQGFENIGVVAFRKQLDFSREFAFVGGKKLAMFCTTVPLAFVLGDYRALVAGMLTGRIAGVALSYAVHPFRPRFCMERAGELLRFSKWLMLAGIVTAIRTRYAELFLGRVGGTATLGSFVVGSEIALLPTTELVAPIGRATFPAWASIAHDAGALRREFLVALGLTTLLGMPAACGIAATASLLVPVMLGERWAAAIEVVAILPWAGVLLMLQGNSHYVLLARDKPRLAALAGACHAALLIVLVTGLGLWLGLRGVLLATVIAAFAMLPVYLACLVREIDLELRQIVAVCWRPCCAAIGMYFCVQWLVATGWPVDAPRAARLGIAIAAGVVCYVTFNGALWVVCGRPEGPERMALRRLLQRNG